MGLLEFRRLDDSMYRISPVSDASLSNPDAFLSLKGHQRGQRRAKSLRGLGAMSGLLVGAALEIIGQYEVASLDIQ